MLDKIKNTIVDLRTLCALDDFKADKALVAAPFGQKYFDQTIKNLTASRAVRALAIRDKLPVLIITSVKTNVSACPKIFKVIRLEPIKDWPAQDTYQSRFIKWAIPLMFNNIGLSIYLDSNVKITSRIKKIYNLFNIIEKHKFVTTSHSTRKGWEDEYNAIKKQKRCLNIENIEMQKAFFQKIGISKSIPVSQTKYLGRNHDGTFDMLSLEVLQQIRLYSERDQLALVYAIHRTGILPLNLPEGEILLTLWSSYFNPNSLCFKQDTDEESVDAWVTKELVKRQLKRIPTLYKAFKHVYFQIKKFII